MNKDCAICKESLRRASEKFNMQHVRTEYSKTLILSFIENVIGSTFISNGLDICSSCYKLINELDQMQKKCEIIKRKLTSYLDCSMTIKKHVLCQTDTVLESILELGALDKNNRQPDELPAVENLNSSSNLYKTSNQLRARERNCHSKQYECHICFKKYSAKRGISLHLKKHLLGKSVKEPVNIVQDYCETNDQIKVEVTDIKMSEELSNQPEELLDESVKIITDLIHMKQDANDSEIKNFLGDEQVVQNENVFDILDIKPDVKNLDNGDGCRLDGNEIKARNCRKKKRLDVLKPHKCSTCEKAFKTQGELKSHMSSHNDMRPFICEVCGRGYKNKHALDIHVGMHNGINPFTCVYCNKSFTQKGALRRHIPIHTGEAPYQCDLCGKRFVHHTSFHIHQLSHTGQKQYKCNICGLALLSGSHLKRHMRVHTGERNYACSTCGKRFAERYNLASHQKLHDNPGSSKAGRRNHRCQVCGRSYEKRLKLEEHLAKEHQKILDISLPNQQQLSSETKTDSNSMWTNNFKIEIS